MFTALRLLFAVIAAVTVLMLPAAAEAVPVGPRDTAVIMFNFGQNDTSKPATATDVRDWVFSNSLSLNAWLKEDSNNTVSLRGQVNSVGDVFGWYTINASSGVDLGANCFETFEQWGAMAKSAATSAGHSLAGYEHLIFVFPKSNSRDCKELNGSGNPTTGQVFNNLGKWNVASFQALLSHELTHALPPGNEHAASTHCVRGGVPVAISISGDCVDEEYGDSYAAVGNLSHAVLNNAYHRARLGYIPWQNVKTVVKTAASSTTLMPSAPSLAAGGGTQLIRIDRDAVDVSRYRHMYLEYRRPSGVFDNRLAGKMGVFVRLADFHGLGDWTKARTYLVDSTPWTDDLDEAMVVGDSIYDPVADFTVRVTALTSASATVAVNPGPPAASQGTVSLSGGVLRFTAASGKRNVISVSRGGGVIGVSTPDPSGGRLTAGSGCTASGATYVSCPSAGVTSARLDLGDKDDIVTATPDIRTDVFAGDGNDVVKGGSSSDGIYGGNGNDDLYGLDGVDMIEPGDGRDLVHGGASTDILSYRDETRPVQVDLAAGTAQTYNYLDSIDGFEQATGGSANDVLTGDSGNNALDGLGGGDTLNGGGGNDVLWGGPGGSGDADKLNGGSGTHDIVNYLNRTNPVYVSINGSADDGEAFEGDTVALEVEDIYGGNGADFLSGSAGANVITGGPGSDTISTGDGNDQISARDLVGDGTLDCGNGTDVLQADLLPFDFSVVGCETTTRS